MPVGLYRVRPAGKLSVNDLVIAMPPDPLATFLADGGYLPRGVPLIKHALALPGQTVCRRGLFIILDGVEMGTARERDTRGRPLPKWEACHVLGEGDIFLMDSLQTGSLDGRYLGVLPVSSIMGRAEAIWTIEGGKESGHQIS